MSTKLQDLDVTNRKQEIIPNQTMTLYHIVSKTQYYNSNRKLMYRCNLISNYIKIYLKSKILPSKAEAWKLKMPKLLVRY